MKTKNISPATLKPMFLVLLIGLAFSLIHTTVCWGKDTSQLTPKQRNQKMVESYGHDSFYDLYFTTLRGADAPATANQKVAQTLKSLLVNPSIPWQLTDYLGLNVLSVAALSGDEDLVAQLIARGADADDLKYVLGSAVLYPAGSDAATIARYQRILQRLIQAGADLNASNGALYLQSPVHRALTFSRFASARTLIEAGATISEMPNSSQDENFTRSLLSYAISSCDVSLIELMLQQGARFRPYDFTSDQTIAALKLCANQRELLRLITPYLPPGVRLDHDEFLFDDQFEQQRQNIIRQNDYCVTRGWDIYQRDLCPQSFTAQLAPGDHILDAGAGESLAMVELAQLRPDLKITALTYTLQSDPYQSLSAEQAKNFHLLKDHFFEEVPDQAIIGEFGKLKAIVEYWGVLAYSTTPDKILNRYFDLLCDDGSLYLMTGTKFLDDLHTKRTSFIGNYARNNSTLHRSWVKLQDGTLITLPDWIDRLPGIAVKQHGGAKVLTMEDRTKIVIPRLKMVRPIDTQMKPDGYLFEEVAQDQAP